MLLSLVLRCVSEIKGTGEKSKLRECGCVMHLKTKRNYEKPGIKDRFERKMRLQGRARK